MAKLTKCKDCGKEVSKKAAMCPHCGATLKKPRGKTGCGTLIIAGVFLVALATQISDIASPPQSKPEKQEKPVISDAECIKDIQCWAKKHSISADIMCPKLIEKYAKYQSRWTDGFLESKFPQIRWKNKKEGIITFIGDKVQFQNGFGAWQTYMYECDYSPKDDEVVGVRVTPRS